MSEAFARHALGVVDGIGAAAACAAILYAAGLVVLPRRAVERARPGDAPAFTGAALFVLTCWFGVAVGIPGGRVIAGFVATTGLLAGIRFRHVASACASIASRRTIGWWLTFSLFYVLMYAFATPSVSGAFLPPAWLGNIDLLTYARFARYVLHLGPSNLAYPGFSYLGDVIYLHTPAVFYLLGGLSMFFGQDPLTAAMPAAYALAALLGVCAARMSHAVFQVPRAGAVAIGAALVSGPFFRYIFGEYFLSTLMAAPVVLFLLWITVDLRATRRVDAEAVIPVASGYVLLLFLYPVMLAIAVVMQLALLVLLWVADARGGRDVPPESVAARVAAWHRFTTVGISVAAVALVLWPRVSWSIRQLRFMSQKDVNGWPLDLIAPAAMLGIPGTWSVGASCTACVAMEATSTAAHVWASVVTGAVACVAATLFVARRGLTSSAQRALVALSGGAFVGYLLCFLVGGPSYQQWKLASYSALPLSFLLVAGVWRAIRGSDDRARPAWRRAATLGVGAATLLMVCGNLAVHAWVDPDLTRLPSGLANVAQIDRLSVPEVTIMMDETADALPTWLALYLLPRTQVHVVSRRMGPSEPLAWETVSRMRPLLMQNVGCEGVGHADTRDVPEVGCLLFAPPTPLIDTRYPFNQTYLFVSASGVGPREAHGRWNREAQVALALTADVTRTNLFDDLFVNLRLTPYVPPGTERQRLRVAWGRQRRAEASLEATQVISLPVQRADWTGGRMWTLPVSIDLPGGVSPPWMYAPIGHADRSPIAVLFEEVSITRAPAGIVMGQDRDGSAPPPRTGGDATR